MTKKKGKPVNFDVMVKFFLQQYNIPTKKDIDKLMERLDRLEDFLRTIAAESKSGFTIGAENGAVNSMDKNKTATDAVLNVIRNSGNGVGFAEIKSKTGFKEKKIRNIIYRMDKNGKIKRVSRGIYTAA